ncbi:dTDP-4-dehydrorhamnose 3,5-epimerase, partial [Bacteroides fragilis]|nr:dTDP-4-dehydrorhamnose 3,5-epimerase [Bacteroides fragilis]MCE8585182.1 dTDP-4-dehydrorhamnose 3,5-epimerase [Bacteroides fragilis]MCE8610236.1 dTDP-4-dehydrorhamnose 3,5-epimerase [Bacteroides fragilis]
IFQYKCDSFYHPEAEGAIAWNDPDLNIDWKIPENLVVLSEKDMRNFRLRDTMLVSHFSEES